MGSSQVRIAALDGPIRHQQKLEDDHWEHDAANCLACLVAEVVRCSEEQYQNDYALMRGLKQMAERMSSEEGSPQYALAVSLVSLSDFLDRTSGR